MKIENLASDSGAEAPQPEVIIYGGSFDPPHRGHLKIVQLIQKHFPAAQIILMPSPQPAGAAGRHKSVKASFEQRLAMCAINFKELISDEKFLISDFEAGLSAPHYTVETIRSFQLKRPHSRLAIIMGQDQCEDFARWHKPLEIIKHVDLILIGREGEQDLEQSFLQMAQTLGCIVEKSGAACYRWVGQDHQVYLFKENLSAAASRLIRQDLAAAVAKNWITQDLSNYIQQHQLYQDQI